MLTDMPFKLDQINLRFKLKVNLGILITNGLVKLQHHFQSYCLEDFFNCLSFHSDFFSLRNRFLPGFTISKRYSSDLYNFELEVYILILIISSIKILIYFKIILTCFNTLTLIINTFNITKSLQY